LLPARDRRLIDYALAQAVQEPFALQDCFDPIKSVETGSSFPAAYDNSGKAYERGSRAHRGDQKQRAGKIQDRYGISKKEAGRQLKASGALALRRQVHAPKAGIFLERGEWVSIQSLFLS
jgi:uncharacterized protein YjbJ (UPF0337 family)